MFIFSRLKTSDSRESKIFKISKIIIIYRGTVDPIIEVSVLSEKKYTSSKTDIGPTGVVMWSEHLFFEPKKLVNFKFIIKISIGA